MRYLTLRSFQRLGNESINCTLSRSYLVTHTYHPRASKLFSAFSKLSCSSQVANCGNLFRLTRYRYVSNETDEEANRYVFFDVEELVKHAVKAAGGQRCTKLSKGSDGSFNRIIQIETDDGKQLVAKIPTSNAGQHHYTTASEVATMTFLRETLGLPVPKIYAWSSRAQHSDIRAEYICMEKVKGCQLSEIWESMSTEDKFKLVKNFAGLQQLWMSFTFNNYGSLYFSSDLDLPLETASASYITTDGREVENSRYAIGPSTGRSWFDDGRDKIECYNGPWSSAEDYKAATGYRDLAAIQKLPKLPTSWIGLYGPGTYIPTRKKKAEALDCYLKLLKYLLPTDSSLSAASLWHTDIHAENVFVNPENPSEITGIIDWQSTEVAPLFEYARQPGFLDHDGPSATGFERPVKPSNFDALQPEVKQKANALWMSQSLEAYYRALVRKTNPRLNLVLAFCETEAENLLVLGRHLLIEGETHYLAAVEMLRSDVEWSQVPLVKAATSESEPDDPLPPFPIDFTDEEIETIYRDSNDAIKAMHAMDELKEMLGSYFPDRGAVLPEQYDTVKSLLSEAKEKMLKKYAQTKDERHIWEQLWPFDD